MLKPNQVRAYLSSVAQERAARQCCMFGVAQGHAAAIRRLGCSLVCGSHAKRGMLLAQFAHAQAKPSKCTPQPRSLRMSSSLVSHIWPFPGACHRHYTAHTHSHTLHCTQPYTRSHSTEKFIERVLRPMPRKTACACTLLVCLLA